MKKDVLVKQEEKLRKMLLTLPDFVADYIYIIQDREVRTRIEYAKDIRLFLEFLTKEGFLPGKSITDVTSSDIDQLTERDVRTFLDYLNSYNKEFLTSKGNVTKQTFTNSPVGKSRKLATLHEFFSYLFKYKLITKDVTRNIDVKTHTKKSIRNRLEHEEIERFYTTIIEEVNVENERSRKFLQKVKLRDYIIVLLFSYTGIRVSELVQLDVDDIGLDKSVMIVTRKGGDQERVTIPSRILEDIHGFINERKKLEVETPALFVSLHKKRIDPKTIRLMLDKYRIRAGIEIKVTPHVFRRTFGTEHYNRYRDMYLTAQVLGHSSAETTRKFYADPSEERKVKSMTEFEYDEPAEKSESSSSEVSVSMDKLIELAKKTGMNIEDILRA